MSGLKDNYAAFRNAWGFPPMSGGLTIPNREVQMSIQDFRALVLVLLDMSDLKDSLKGKPVETAVINGAVLAEAINLASELAVKLNLQEWLATEETRISEERASRKNAYIGQETRFEWQTLEMSQRDREHMDYLREGMERVDRDMRCVMLPPELVGFSDALDGKPVMDAVQELREMAGKTDE